MKFLKALAAFSRKDLVKNVILRSQPGKPALWKIFKDINCNGETTC
jgi:hypothetical protein